MPMSPFSGCPRYDANDFGGDSGSELNDFDGMAPDLHDLNLSKYDLVILFLSPTTTYSSFPFLAFPFLVGAFAT